MLAHGVDFVVFGCRNSDSLGILTHITQDDADKTFFIGGFIVSVNDVIIDKV